MNGFQPDQASAIVHPSPNFGERRGVVAADMILLHYTGMESGDVAEAWLCNAESEVSCHYVVHEDGRIVQLVREVDRAWHAGKSSWHRATDINSHSVGIEIVNPGHTIGYVDFPEMQIAAVIDLCRGIVARHRIVPARILAHSDVAPGRKIDPGERFPWSVLADSGLGHFVKPAPVRRGPALSMGDRGGVVGEIQTSLALYGYGLEVTGIFDERTETVVAAFQRHFRPALVDGIADASTLDTLDRLLDALPAASV